MTKRQDAPSSMVRIRVMKRDRFQCTYCGTPGTDAELEVDHIVAVSKGGSHHMSNLTTACRACNQKKSNGSAEIVRKPAAISAPAINGLVGLYLHTIKDGKINWHGHIIGMDGDMALVQLFSWLSGEPTEVVPIAKNVIYSDGCKLYQTAEAMGYAYEQQERRLGRFRGRC